MFQLSKRLFYAVEAVLYIAYNAGAKPVSSRAIAVIQGMKPRHLEQMMQRLVHAGVLRGVRGPRGGYLLAKEKRRITVAEICKAINEKETLPTSTPLGNEIVAPLVEHLEKLLDAQLQETTLADLYDQAHQRHIRKSAEGSGDFTI